MGTLIEKWAAPEGDLGTWYICCPAYEDSVSEDGNFRSTETLIVRAKSEEEAAEIVLAGTKEPWYGCVVVPAEGFLA